MLKISFRNSPEFIEQMRAKGPRIVSVLMTKLTSLMFQLATKIQTGPLSGETLTPRTGKLRGSITPIPATAQGTKISAAVEGAGGPAFYGKWHEEGTSRTYEIRATKARALHFIAGGKSVFASRVSHPAIVQRAFMKPSLDSFAPEIISGLNAAVDKVIKED